MGLQYHTFVFHWIGFLGKFSTSVLLLSRRCNKVTCLFLLSTRAKSPQPPTGREQAKEADDDKIRLNPRRSQDSFIIFLKKKEQNTNFMSKSKTLQRDYLTRLFLFLAQMTVTSTLRRALMVKGVSHDSGTDSPCCGQAADSPMGWGRAGWVMRWGLRGGCWLHSWWTVQTQTPMAWELVGQQPTALYCWVNVKLIPYRVILACLV